MHERPYSKTTRTNRNIQYLTAPTLTIIPSPFIANVYKKRRHNILGKIANDCRRPYGHLGFTDFVPCRILHLLLNAKYDLFTCRASTIALACLEMRYHAWFKFNLCGRMQNLFALLWSWVLHRLWERLLWINGNDPNVSLDCNRSCKATWFKCAVTYAIVVHYVAEIDLVININVIRFHIAMLKQIIKNK